MSLPLIPGDGFVGLRPFRADTAVPDSKEVGAHALLRERLSIRHYKAKQPDESSLARIFASVAQAPSAHNRQPWRFLLITDEGVKASLARAMGDRLAADRQRDGDDEAAVAADVARSFRRITGTPVVVVVALSMAEMHRYPDDKRSRAEWLMAAQSTAMAGQNLLLAAAAEGLAACWMCAPLFCESEVKMILTLPEDWQVQGLVTLGYAGRPAPARPRKPIGEFVFTAVPAGERQRA
jgi:coenzyme F420-0:L-glutamate ligase / coenzyme F420-1:gamma-L-glutamate ligase